MTRSFKLSPDIRYRVIDDEAVVVRQREGDVLVINQVGARVLQLIDEGLTPDDVSDRVASEFEAPEAVIREDVARFFSELEKLEVLEEVQPDEDAP
jgi:hypothetical protein